VQAHLRQAERIMRRFPLPECRERAFAAMDMLGLANKAAVASANLSHGDQKLLDIGLALVLDTHDRKPHLIARAGVGFVPEDRQVFPEHSVEENLMVHTNRSQGVNGPMSVGLASGASRACCSSTSRPPAWGPRNAGR
jgi:ABC-type uncharacterized transport system ATPase subunit